MLKHKKALSSANVAEKMSSVVCWVAKPHLIALKSPRQCLGPLLPLQTRCIWALENEGWRPRGRSLGLMLRST